MSELIIAPDAPSAAGPYSPGLVVGDWIFLSGQGGFDPDTGELVSDTVADQTTRRSATLRLCCARQARRLTTSSSAWCISATSRSSTSSMPATRSSSRAG
jgi:enamine deaminase RidA (YjgF/YER057c/UK114 family)